MLIVSFAGNGLLFNGMPQFEFVNSLNKITPNCDKLFYVDMNQRFYVTGIQGISNNIKETKLYLLNKIKN